MKKLIKANKDYEYKDFERINRNLWDILSDASTVQRQHEFERDVVYDAVTHIKNLCWEAQAELNKIERFYDINIGL